MKSLLAKIFGTSAKDQVRATAPVDTRIDAERAAEWVRQGNQALGEGRLQDAIEAYRSATQLDTANKDAKVNLAFALSEAGDYAPAEQLIQQVLQMDAQSSDAHFILATIARHTLRYALAKQHYARAIDLAPELQPAYVDLAFVLFELHDIQAAEELLLAGYARFPKATPILTNLGAVYLELQRPVLVRKYCEEAIAIDGNCLFALSNLGVVEAFHGDPQRAIQLLRRALDLTPKDHELWLNYGMCLILAAEYDLAREAYQYAIHLQPEFASAHTDLGLLELLTGNMATGWAEHEWRLRQAKSAVASSQLLRGTRWDGGPIPPTHTLLLHCEQGIGDTLQFLRFVPEVRTRHTKLVLLVQKGLKKLASQFGLEVVEEGGSMPPHEFHCSFMSLPFVLAHHTAPKPLWTAPYIQSDPEAARFWSPYVRKKLDVPRKIGITWAGNPKHRRNHERSIALSQFVSVLPPACKALCLQASMDEADRRYVSVNAALETIDYPIHDFADTSAIIAELDLVISVDTSVAHLAAAMGKPVWLLISYVPDWRWLIQGADSPWYPSIRLFRQPTPGDWDTPMAEIRRLLQST